MIRVHGRPLQRISWLAYSKAFRLRIILYTMRIDRSARRSSSRRVREKQEDFEGRPSVVAAAAVKNSRRRRHRRCLTWKSCSTERVARRRIAALPGNHICIYNIRVVMITLYIIYIYIGVQRSRKTKETLELCLGSFIDFEKIIIISKHICDDRLQFIIKC